MKGRLTALACVLAGWLPRRRRTRGVRVPAVRTGTGVDGVRVFVDGREIKGEPVSFEFGDDGPNHFRGERG